MKINTIRLILLICVLSFSRSLMAHTGLDVSHGLLNGLVHPLTGADHLLVILVIGLWAAQGTDVKKWMPLLVFPVFILIGAELALSGVSFIGFETVIALSILIVGLLLTSRIKVQTSSIAMISILAFFHGQARMLEIPVLTSPVLYNFGLLFTTFCLLLVSYIMGQWLQRIQFEWLLRGIGMVVSSFGAYLMLVTS